MNTRIKSWQPHAVTFPIVVERMNAERRRVSEEVGTFTIEPGERVYTDVPANVLAAIRTHHEPSMMRILDEAAAV